jgi:hypothetical protein
MNFANGLYVPGLNHLAFYSGGDWKDAIIRFSTKSPVSHVEWVLPTAPGEELDQDLLCFSASPREGIVRFKRIVLATDPKWLVVPIVLNCPLAPLLQAMEGEEGKPYDWAGVLSWGLNKPSGTGWYCSKLCTWLAGLGGAFQFLASPNVHPGQLMDLAQARWEVTRPAEPLTTKTQGELLS